MSEKQFCIYILSNKNNTTLYTGVTSNLKARVWQHKNKFVEGFTKKYNLRYVKMHILPFPGRNK